MPAGHSGIRASLSLWEAVADAMAKPSKGRETQLEQSVMPSQDHAPLAKTFPIAVNRSFA